MALIDLIQKQMTPEVMGALAKNANLDTKALEGLLPAAIGALTQGMAKTASTPQGAGALSALADKDGDGIPDALEAVMSMGGGKGDSILNQMLGGQRGGIEAALSKMTGAKAGQMGSLLAMLAPLVLKQLTAAKRTQGLNPTDLGAMLGAEGQRAMQGLPKELSGLAAMLDANKDGNIADDVARMAQKGGFLSRLFGRR